MSRRQMAAHDIAPELWLEILGLSFSRVDILGSASRTAPWNLMAVSKTWRDLILSTPQMWMRLHFSFGDNKTIKLCSAKLGEDLADGLHRRIALTLERSVPHLLIVTSSSESATTASVQGAPGMGLLTANLHRVEAFGNCGRIFNLSDLCHAGGITKVSMPVLRALNHDTTSGGDDVTFLFKRICAPNIVNLRLTCHILDSLTWAPFQLENLRSLSLRQCFIRFPSLLKTLTEVPRLEILVFDELRAIMGLLADGSPEPALVVNHTTLKSLTMVERRVFGPLSFILEHLRTPSLTHLSIKFSSYGSQEPSSLVPYPDLRVVDVAMFIKRSNISDKLVQLELHPPGPDETFEVHPILSNSQSVNSLGISLNTVEDIATLSLVGSDSLRVLPHLTSLTVAHVAHGEIAAKALLEMLKSRQPVLRDLHVLATSMDSGSLLMEKLRDLGEKSRFEVFYREEETQQMRFLS